MHSLSNCVRAFAFLFAVAGLAGFIQADVVLIRGGRAEGKIYVDRALAGTGAPATQPVEPYAELPPAGELLRDLNYHLKKMSGAELEVVATDDPSIVKPPAIVLGTLAVKLGAEPAKKTESGEGFRLLTRNGLVLVGGQAEAGTHHGVYELLRRLGCDWVMPGEVGEVIPQRATVAVPDLDESQAPDFLFRHLWLHGYPGGKKPGEDERFCQWQRRQKGGFWHHPAIDTGSHAWEGIPAAHKELFEAHPELYALRRDDRDGAMKRMGPQLESTDPRIVQLFVDDIRQTYKKNIEAGRWTKDTPAGFGIGPADGLGFSVSPEAINASSGRIDPIVGEPDQTDLLVLLGNRILEQIHPEYPNAYVGFYSYSVHADYPLRYKPHRNIVITLAPITYSRYHSFLDQNTKSQAYYHSVLDQWGRLAREQGNILIYRGYNWNLAENMVPYSKARIWGEEVPYYKKLGVMGFTLEAARSWSVLGPSDYVFIRLAWDSSQSWKAILHEYCDHAYGAAAAGPMERYFLNQIERQSAAGQEAGSYHAIHLIYDDAFVRRQQEQLDAALAAAKTEDQRTRITYIGYALEALRRYLAYHQATLRFDFAEAKRCYEAMLDHYQRTYDINMDLVSDYVKIYLERFVGPFVEEAARYSAEPYRIVQRIPDELPVIFDPNAAGERMNYFSPAINDSGFIHLKTISTTWDAQGLGAMRAGAVWYRHRFTLPAEAKGQPIRLFIGSVDDEARVWINGKPAGTSGVNFSMPFVFDLSDGVRYDGENLLAIEVVHNSGGNEQGTGGILRPCFLFTGPRGKE